MAIDCRVLNFFKPKVYKLFKLILFYCFDSFESIKVHTKSQRKKREMALELSIAGQFLPGLFIAGQFIVLHCSSLITLPFIGKGEVKKFAVNRI